MKNIMTLQQFVEKLNQKESDKKAEQETNRNQELAGLKQSNIYRTTYAIQISIQRPSDLLLEHEDYKQFKKSTNRYTKHPENLSIPVKAHYHVYPSNSKKELYAVNIDDGKAHHKDNRGHQVPKKEADELRSLGVKIPPNNILESRQFTLDESESKNIWMAFIMIDQDE